MIESAEIMVIGIEIGIDDIEAARRKTREIREAGIKIVSEREVEEILGMQEIHGVVEEVAMIGMADVIEIEIEIGREMAIGMEQETGESEVSTMMMGLCWFIGADLMYNKTVAETNLANDQDPEIMKEGEAGVHEETPNFAARRNPSPFQGQRRSSPKAEQLHRQ
jgi:hypothetical protein